MTKNYSDYYNYVNSNTIHWQIKWNLLKTYISDCNIHITLEPKASTLTRKKEYEREKTKKKKQMKKAQLYRRTKINLVLYYYYYYYYYYYWTQSKINRGFVALAFVASYMAHDKVTQNINIWNCGGKIKL